MHTAPKKIRHAEGVRFFDPDGVSTPSALVAKYYFKLLHHVRLDSLNNCVINIMPKSGKGRPNSWFPVDIEHLPTC